MDAGQVSAKGRPKMTHRDLLLIGLAGALVLGGPSCGGKTETDSGSQNFIPASKGGSAGQGIGGAAGSVGGSAGSGIDAGTGGASAGAGGAGAAGAAATGGAAGTGTGGAAGQPTDAGAAGEVLCGWGICSLDLEYCCAAYQPQGAGECRPMSQLGNCTGSSSIAMLCDGPEDCPGGFCCGNNGSGLPYVDVIECASSCTIDWPHTLFCHPWASDVCPNGTACKPAPMLSAYYSCQPI
jgi:hypothetical protein